MVQGWRASGRRDEERGGHKGTGLDATLNLRCFVASVGVLSAWTRAGLDCLIITILFADGSLISMVVVEVASWIYSEDEIYSTGGLQARSRSNIDTLALAEYTFDNASLNITKHYTLHPGNQPRTIFTC